MFVNASTSLLAHQPKVGRKVINRTRRFWTCLVILWDISLVIFIARIRAIQSDRKHQMWIDSSRKFKESTNWHKSVEVSGIHWNTMRSSLVHFSLWSEEQQNIAWPTKTSGNQWGFAQRGNARASPHCLWGYIYILCKHHTPSQVSTPPKHHMPSHMSASAKHPVTRQFPEKHQMRQLSFQRNQKFLLQNIYSKSKQIRKDFYGRF